jgi:hypothetical protein
MSGKDGERVARRAQWAAAGRLGVRAPGVPVVPYVRLHTDERVASSAFPVHFPRALFLRFPRALPGPSQEGRECLAESEAESAGTGRARFG